MQKWLSDLRLPDYSRLWGTLVLFGGIVVSFSCLLFGLVPTLILCIIFSILYSIVCFVCFHTDGVHLREKLDGYYEALFIRILSYTHRKNSKDSNEKDQLATKKVQASKPCHREAQKIIQLIMRDFIDSWYGSVTSDLEFPDDIQKLLEHVALETNIRMQKIDLEEIITDIVTLVIPYIETVNESGMRSYNNIEVFDVNSETCLRAFECTDVVSHRALNSRELELKYHRQALDALIQCAFPDKYQKCDLKCMFVRELLLKNIIEPLFDLLCDPHFLISCIPLILKKASPEKVQRELAEIKQENEELERKLSHGRLILKIKGSPLSQRRRFQTQSGHFCGSDHFSHAPAPDIPPGSPPLPRKSKKSKGASSKRATWAAFPTDTFEAPLVHPAISHDTESPQLGVEPEAFVILDSNSPPKESSLWPYRSSTLTPPGNERVTDDNGRRISEGDDSFAIIDYERGPIYFDRHVRVVSGSGNSSHVAYIFKFPKRLLDEEELESVGISDGDTHLEGMKRYSQFDKFHSSVLKTPMATHLKGISLPSKMSLSKVMSKLSIGTRDPDPVEIQERIQGLESYLQAISAIPSIASSPKFHEFLITGIESLKQANIVKLQPKAARRKTFLGIRKGPHLPSFREAQKAERIPKRQIETVLSAYLDTNLPLPSHSLHTLYNLKTNDPQPSQSPHESSPTLSEQATGTDPTTLAQSLDSDDDLPTYNRRPTLVNEHSMNGFLSQNRQSPLVKAFSADSPTHNHRATVINAASSCSPTSHRRASLGNDYDVIDTPNSSSSGASGEARYVPLADLATTPKASEYVHYSPNKRSLKRGFQIVDTDTDGSSVNSFTPNIGLALEGEELTTAGSLVSISNTSFVSASEPEDNTPEVQVKDTLKPTDSEVTSSIQTQEPRLSKFDTLKARLISFFHSFIFYVSLLYEMVLKGSTPVTNEVSSSLAEEHTQRIPLSNAILALASEVSRRHCPELWACHANTQLALLVLVGGGMERYLWKELKELLHSSENWSRGLYNLRHTLWPQGTFMSGSSSSPTEIQKKEAQREAAAIIKQFLPNFLPAIVGSSDYDNAVNHVLDCLQNPKITRYFVLRIIDMILIKLIPELENKKFQNQLARLRTLNPPPTIRFSTRPT